MDVEDLLSFKPESIPKRKQDDDDGDDAKHQGSSNYSKKQRIDEKILEVINSADADDGETQALDENGLKKLALLFEKRVLKNQVTRLKFQEPEKFMESEVKFQSFLIQLRILIN